MENKNEKFIILAGPTAVGKTSTSIALAKKIDGEIISADSMQIYKYMDIGTAKITNQEMDGIPHHMIDIITPDTEFTVSDYSQSVKELFSSIFSRNKVPIVVGGTGLYINSLLYDMDFNEAKPNKEFRADMERLRLEKGNLFLYEMLVERAPLFAQSLHYNNYKRVIRALEILESKENIDRFITIEPSVEKKNCNIYILSLEREILYNRINQRVDQMIQKGLEKEVQDLLRRGYSSELPSMKGIGYRQMITYLQEELSLEEAVEQIKRDSRRYAKRQITWFKRYETACWIDTAKYTTDDIIRQIMDDF